MSIKLQFGLDIVWFTLCFISLLAKISPYKIFTIRRAAYVIIYLNISDKICININPAQLAEIASFHGLVLTVLNIQIKHR